MSNSGVATIGGTQAWGANAIFINSGEATFTTNAGSQARNLSINSNGGTIVFASSQSLKSISISGGKVNILPGGSTIVGVNDLSVTSPAEAMDLADGTLVYLYDTTSPATTVRSLLSSTQMYSSLADAQHRVGYAEAVQVYPTLPATLGNEPLDATTLLAKLTAAGDTDLDGVVDAIDLGNLAAHWSSSDAFWFDGDFTYDGNVDVADLKLLAINFTAAAEGASLETLLISFGLPVDAVPEPAIFAPLVFGAVLLRRRRS
jgi:hypothetical protein